MSSIGLITPSHSTALATLNYGGKINQNGGASFDQLLSQARQDAGSDTNVAKDKKLAVKFEASVLASLLQPIFDNLNTEPPFGGGSQEAAMKSFLVQEYATALAQQQSFGFGGEVVKQISKNDNSAIPENIKQ